MERSSQKRNRQLYQTKSMEESQKETRTMNTKTKTDKHQMGIQEKG